MNSVTKTKLLMYVLLMLMAACQSSRRTTVLVHTECDSLFFDTDTGMVNAVSPMLPQADIKEWFTCFTGSSPDGANDNCGGGVFYEKHGFYYYTYFDYVEVHSGFKGKVTKDLLHSNRESVRALLGSPVDTRYKEMYSNLDFFDASYGCLKFEYDSSGQVEKIAAHFSECESVDVCR